jgi:hypothetical protein
MCNYTFGYVKDNGKVVIQGSAGYCRSCYNKLYSSKEPRKCANCGGDLYKSMKAICRVCDVFLPKQSKSLKNQHELWLKKSNIKLQTSEYELIRRLLAKFQSKNYGYVDILRVADVYTYLFSVDTYLDTCSEKEQITIMLKRLKELWHNNRSHRKI